jgi:hypothetical protein
MRKWPFEAQGKRVAIGKQVSRVACQHKFWLGLQDAVDDRPKGRPLHKLTQDARLKARR